MQSSLPRGAQCGSQRTQFQYWPASGSAVSTTMVRSRGLCRTAAWATSQRASARDALAGPASPTTPSWASGSETGTLNETGTGGSSLSCAEPFSLISSIAAGPSNSPIRIRSVSASSARRSHSRRRGPVAVSRICAGSMASSRTVASRSVSLAIFSRYCRACCRWDLPSFFRSPIHWLSIMTGLVIMNRANSHSLVTSTMTSPRTTGTAAPNSMARLRPPFLGSPGTSILTGGAADRSRGGRW